MLILLGAASTVVVCAVFWRDTFVPTLWIPVVISLLPLVAANLQQGIVLRATAGALLVIWAGLGALSVGPFYIPAAVAMWFAYARARKAEGTTAPQ